MGVKLYSQRIMQGDHGLANKASAEGLRGQEIACIFIPLFLAVCFDESINQRLGRYFFIYYAKGTRETRLHAFQYFLIAGICHGQWLILNYSKSWRTRAEISP